MRTSAARIAECPADLCVCGQGAGDGSILLSGKCQQILNAGIMDTEIRRDGFTIIRLPVTQPQAACELRLEVPLLQGAVADSRSR